MDEIIQAINSVGFPIFISVFLLVRIEPTLNKLSKSIDKIIFFLEHERKK